MTLQLKTRKFCLKVSSVLHRDKHQSPFGTNIIVSGQTRTTVYRRIDVGSNKQVACGDSHSILMNAIDEYDIRDTFQALDSDLDGFLTAQEFHTLWMGLGFRPERLNEQELERIVAAGIKEETANKEVNSLISLEVALKVLKNVRIRTPCHKLLLQHMRQVRVFYRVLCFSQHFGV